jgi:hypothetical protein
MSLTKRCCRPAKYEITTLSKPSRPNVWNADRKHFRVVLGDGRFVKLEIFLTITSSAPKH